ncbi:sensor histidine kinase [Piscinibacter sp.]|uniref:sensor histidine kinase n=1 Tax=Piscinibacter sp. TaxID=1903157 RepID=UPI002C71887F|nr:ATP-binding protein [Albitalea sp.]HUG21662.1 ATP-binding protein [Albitalea sp.]
MAPSSIAALSLIEELHELSREADGDSESLQAMLSHIVRSFGAQSGSLAVVDREEPAQLRIVAGIDLPAGVIGQAVPLGTGVLGKVAQSGEPMLINGELKRAGDDANAEREERARGRPRSAICWPLSIKNRRIGALSMNRLADATPFDDSDVARGRSLVTLVALVVDNANLHSEQMDRIDRLSQLNEDMRTMNAQLKATQQQLLQSEKMASIGQLAAGVAHEINNPVGYVYSNLTTLRGYVDELLNVVRHLRGKGEGPEPVCDVDFLEEDIPQLVAETREGLDRVKKIVQDLKDFSRIDKSDDWEDADLVKGLESTLNIVQNEIKYKAAVVKDLTPLPEVPCLPTQLNQVFMNLLVNAAQAIQNKGTITLRSGFDETKVWVEVGDDGCGMPADVQSRIFEPFYTTKPVGQGTGLGLSVSYSIVRKHNGKIELHSQPGAGTRFRVVLPRVREAALEEVAHG